MTLRFKRKLLLAVRMASIFLFIEPASANFVFGAFNSIEALREKDSVRSFFNSFKYFEPLVVFAGIHAGVEVAELALEWFTILRPNNRRKRLSRINRDWGIDQRKLYKLGIASLIMLLKQDWNTNPANLFSIAQPIKEDLKDSNNARTSYIEKLPEDQQLLYKNHPYADINYIDNLEKEYKKINEDRNLKESDRALQVQNMIDRNPHSEELIRDIAVLFSNKKNKNQQK